MGRDRILVVDDDPDNRAMIGHFLASWGYDVDDAKNGKIALEKVKEQPPNLVLLDLEMPVMNGYETCERLKTDPKTEWIPIVMFTGLEQMQNRIQGFEHGADDYVVKTVEPEELRIRIEQVLKRSQRFADLASTPMPVEEEQETKDLAVSVSLSRIPFPDAIRLVLAHGKNGVIHLSNAKSRGAVHVVDGAIVHAVAGEERGEDAFYQLALWKTGRFDFQDKDPGPEKTIGVSTRSLLVEANRRMDAWHMISSKVPSFDLVPKWIPLSDAESIRLTKNDWSLIRLVDGRRSIRKIVEELNTDIFEAGRVVFSLLTVGVLRLDEGETQTEEVFSLVPQRGDSIAVEEPFELTAAEWDLLARADGTATLGSVREAMNVPAPAFMKMVRGLKDRGFLRLKGRERQKRKRA